MQLLTSTMGSQHRAPQGNRNPNFNAGRGQPANGMSNNYHSNHDNWGPNNNQQQRQGNYNYNGQHFNQPYY